jgi:hypothetical protein
MSHDGTSAWTPADVQHLVNQLQDALGLHIVCGSITLNLNQQAVQSVKTETYTRLQPHRPEKR